MGARATEEARFGITTPLRAPAGTQASPPQATPPRLDPDYPAQRRPGRDRSRSLPRTPCLLYTSDAADDM
eukprot:2444501-Alexandrium_andersonii.AAC.1